MVKMNNKMIALCSAALGSIYLTGYTLTEHPAQTASSATPLTKGIVTGQPTHKLHSPSAKVKTPPPASVKTSKSVPASGSVKSSSQTKTSTSSPSKPSAPKQNQNKVYKDGTFSGEASNHIGGVQVAVTTKADKIVSVKITSCTTSYSESNIAGLPQEVLSRQSSNIDFVSGATLSSEDFQGAVQQALQQAKL
jgi:uncharacterized protein with FMN-binding domain